MRATLGAGTPDATCQALREASGGNPFYLGELLRAQATAETGGRSLPASAAVARHVEARIRRLDPAALGLAQALAVLGDEGQLRHAMALTGLDTDAAVRLAAALVRVEVLATAHPPRFLHPVVRAAVGASLGSDERDRMHRAAARELDRDGAAPGRVAAHLMHTQPAAANWDTRAALLWTLITAERFQEVDGALPAMVEAATRGGSARGLIAVYSSLGFCKLRLGALPEADGAARVALRILQEGDFTAGLGVAAIAAEVAVEAGQPDEAQALLELIPPAPAGVLSVLAPAAAGRLSLARGDGRQALTCFQACLAMFGADLWGIEIRDVGYLHARSGAAQAWLLLGDRDRARALAEAELADARVSGGRRALGIALRVAGLATGGADGLERLSESAGVLRESPALLERAKSIAELGAALRRAGQRAAARPLLAEALDLAAGCGARPLASRAHAELAAAGGRPRRERRHGLDALTPSELRVARLAADGQTNRQIAHGLYVTLKTVETHLAHVYAKLGISHRGELPAALAGENLGVPTPTRTAGR